MLAGEVNGRSGLEDAAQGGFPLAGYKIFTFRQRATSSVRLRMIWSTKLRRGARTCVQLIMPPGL